VIGLNNNQIRLVELVGGRHDGSWLFIRSGVIAVAIERFGSGESAAYLIDSSTNRGECVSACELGRLREG